MSKKSPVKLEEAKRGVIYQDMVGDFYMRVNKVAEHSNPTGIFTPWLHLAPSGNFWPVKDVCVQYPLRKIGKSVYE